MVYLIVVCFIVVWYLVEINFSQFKTFKIEILKIKPKPQIDGFKIFKVTVKVSKQRSSKSRYKFHFIPTKMNMELKIR